MIGKTYRTERGMPVRVVALHTFEGVEYAFAEALRVGVGLADMVARETSTLTPIDAAVFEAELAKARKQAAAEAKKAAAREDGERYGIGVTEIGARGNRSQVIIVRCTATRWIALDGRAFRRDGRGSHRDGCRIGCSSLDGSVIAQAGLLELQDFAGERERVDIVAERKAAAEREAAK